MAGGYWTGVGGAVGGRAQGSPPSPDPISAPSPAPPVPALLRPDLQLHRYEGMGGGVRVSSCPLLTPRARGAPLTSPPLCAPPPQDPWPCSPPASPSCGPRRAPPAQVGPGDSVTARCEALSALPELTLLYWLGNGSFVEQLPPHGSAALIGCREEPRPQGALLRRDLRLEPFCARHAHTAFTCVLLSPQGARTADLRWPTAHARR
uniref:Uncharacterized protein n=1 Tax=Melopsittacus undulatus TaxID=13146 RepID=A0A8V5GPN6_MELUD